MSVAEQLPWHRTVATGIGSLPGTDIRESVRLVLGELPDLPYLPELPARGPGADLVGRAATFLTDLPVELQPSGWRLTAHPGRDLQRAQDFLARDLDALEELAADHDGPVKVQAVGPWTLAASLELAYGDKALADHGAVRDLIASLADGLAAHVAELRRRLPAAQVVVQLDEPTLPAVLTGRVRTASGFGTLRSVAEEPVRARLAEVVAAVGAPVVVHCCAPDPPLRLLREAGASGLSLDVLLLDRQSGPVRDRLEEQLAEAVEAGSGLFLGVLPATDAELSDLGATVGTVRTLWQRLGLGTDLLATRAVTTPTCGLAGASPAYARAALSRCREAAARLSEEG